MVIYIVINIILIIINLNIFRIRSDIIDIINMNNLQVFQIMVIYFVIIYYSTRIRRDTNHKNNLKVLQIFINFITDIIKNLYFEFRNIEKLK